MTEAKFNAMYYLFNFADLCQLVKDFADHAGQSWRQTLLDKSRCVLFSVLSRQNISHWSFDGAARIGYLRQGMN